MRSSILWIPYTTLITLVSVSTSSDDPDHAKTPALELDVAEPGSQEGPHSELSVEQFIPPVGGNLNLGMLR